MVGAGLVALHHEILLFAIVGLAIGGVDDLVVDLLFLSRLLARADRLCPSPAHDDCDAAGVA